MAMSMTTKYSIPENAVVVGLCAGRHDMPVGEFIFSTEVDPTDFRAMSRTVDAFLDARVGTHLSNYGTRFNDNEMSDIEVTTGNHPLIVYVTGLTACVAAVIRGCVYRGIELTLMHYDRTTGGYLPQAVIGNMGNWCKPIYSDNAH